MFTVIYIVLTEAKNISCAESLKNLYGKEGIC